MMAANVVEGLAKSSRDSQAGVLKVDFNRSLAGRKVLVTGASRGIGSAIVTAMAEAGADVAVNYRSS